MVARSAAILRPPVGPLVGVPPVVPLVGVLLLLASLSPGKLLSFCVYFLLQISIMYNIYKQVDLCYIYIIIFFLSRVLASSSYFETRLHPDTFIGKHANNSDPH